MYLVMPVMTVIAYNHPVTHPYFGRHVRRQPMRSRAHAKPSQAKPGCSGQLAVQDRDSNSLNGARMSEWHADWLSPALCVLLFAVRRPCCTRPRIPRTTVWRRPWRRDSNSARTDLSERSWQMKSVNNKSNRSDSRDNDPTATRSATLPLSLLFPLACHRHVRLLFSALLTALQSILFHIAHALHSPSPFQTRFALEWSGRCKQWMRIALD